MSKPSSRSIIDDSIKTDKTRLVKGFDDVGIKFLTSRQVSRPQDLIFTNYSNMIDTINAIFLTKTLGLGDSYINGLFECEDLFGMLLRLAQTNQYGGLPLIDKIPNSPQLILQVLQNKFLDLPQMNPFEVAKVHYDLPPELFVGVEGAFGGMLGSTRKYTCGDWSSLDAIPANLDLAQQNSLSYIKNQLNLYGKNNPVILDCGCGWGAVPEFLNQTLGVGKFTYIGISISEPQIKTCKKLFAGQNHINFVNYSFNDPLLPLLRQFGYESVDAVVFLGSLEHAGTKGSEEILERARSIIKHDGRCYVQIVGADHKTALADPYMNKYIFPNFVIMSPIQVGQIIEKNRYWRLETITNTPQCYANTLLAWHANFERDWEHIAGYIKPILQQTPFETLDQWKRHWEFYLLLCAAFYKAGTYPQLYRITLSPNLNRNSKIL